MKFRVAEQFQEFQGKKVLVSLRREPKKYVGTLVYEDPYFIFLHNAEIIGPNGKIAKAPKVSISKHIVGEVRELEEKA